MEKLTLSSMGSTLLADASAISNVQLVEGNVIKNTGIVAWTLFKATALMTNLVAHTGIWLHNQAVRTKPYNYVATNKIVDLVSTETAMDIGEDIATFTALSYEYSKQVFTRSKHESSEQWYNRIMALDLLTAKQKSTIRAAGTRTFKKSGEKEYLHRSAALEFYLKKWKITVK